MALTKAQKESNEKYNKEHYEDIMFNLNIDTDAKLIASIDRAINNGKTKREWLREVYNITH